MAEPNRPTGYVPRYNEALLGDLPEEYKKYIEPPTITDTITPKESVFVAGTDVAEEGSAEAGEVKKKRERKIITKRTERVAQVASDRFARGDAVAALFAQVEKDPEQAKRAKYYAPFKDSFREDLEEEAEEYPLVKYMDGQKAIEERPQYKLDTQVYMPSSRKAFYSFIQQTYAKEFNLPNEVKEIDTNACEKLLKGGESKVEPFRYQRFISEYIRQSSPYRGMLVYHGLGSGKTCSSIAAAEALYGIANKKIIVMTPQSLRDNFMKEVTFCGFRHFSLYNHWVKVPLLERDLGEDGRIQNQLYVLHEIYARSVLSLSNEYVQRLINFAKSQKELVKGEYPNAYIWIADFDKEPNYKTLSPTEQDQIRSQLKETIANRIQFIHYNGIKNAELKALCCKGDAFDNAVIVVDEIHNLVRLMTGTIEPFLKARGGKERIVAAEGVAPGRWMPKLCQPGAKGEYSRGYMFYRLLVGAKNSKIVGLSGTPVINFPEELGVLSNVLAGYIDCAEFVIDTLDDEQIAAFESTANQDPRIDFVATEVGKGSTNFNARISVFNEGYIKVLKEDGKTFEGVKQSNAPEAQVGIQDVTKRLVAAVAAKGIKINSDTVTYKSYPRLPPEQEAFRDEFIDVVNTDLNKANELVLKKRLTGIVSYYKGNKPEFFPSVASDNLVECDFSSFAFKKYITERLREIKQESGNEIADKGANLYAAVEAYSKAANPSSYRFRSRACCNFAFPFERPYPKSKQELTEEVEEIAEDLEIAEASSDPDIDRDLAKAARDEDAEIEVTLGTEPFQPKTESVEDAGSIADAVVDVVSGVVTITAKTYQEQKREAMAKLNAERSTYLTLADEESGLKKYSRKLFEILTRINASPGPALVYSQFEELEGMGVLGASLKANGYDQLKFTGKWFGQEPDFDEESLKSLAKGPGAKRFVVYSGKEQKRQRAIILAMFNSQWDDIPKGIRAILKKSGFDLSTKYLHGEVIKCIGITGAGAEGLSLRNVRQVHIMEPFWNMVRLEQVKGRAVRICSHKDLPLAERQVDIFTYVSRFSAEQIEKRDGEGGLPRSIQTVDGDIDPDTKKERVMTSDQKVLNVAVRKETISRKLQGLMKEVAIDCTINAADNEPSIRCFTLDAGSKNPYTFDPNLEQDKITTMSELEPDKEVQEAPKVVVKKSVVQAPVAEERYTQKIGIIMGGKKRSFLLSPFDEITGKATLHAEDDVLLKTPLGECYVSPGSQSGIGNIRFYKKKVEAIDEGTATAAAATEGAKEEE